MNTAYLEFEAGYNDLIKQLEYHSDAEEIIYSVSNLTDPKLSDVVSLASGYKDSKYRNVSARFNYNVAIISLYGLFEQFIESQIENFVKNISRLALCYDDLPENLKSNHSLLTLKYAQKNLSDKYIESETKNTNHKLLIQSLYESLNHKAENFSIDAKVFSSHTSNFRCELINVMFGYIGVERVIEKPYQ
ncbi:TPA: MAE_28990/MAE_18760 family HEPN-like nuclease [Yersinia enterocolitica]